nr:helix-turn-helix domain-containing protein [Bacteriovorax sp. HI3]
MLIKNLKQLLEENNLSIAELARETQVPKSTLNTWLKGRSPNLEQLERVANYFNTSIDYLAFGKTSKPPLPTLVYRAEIGPGQYEVVVRKISD